MKLQRDTSETEIGGAVKAPQAFQIAASREAFNILSSGLYNDKILAIIRELCCNAYDAHVAAGKKEVPFDLHLPTSFEPQFSVKDYGVGMSHEDIMELYTTYFSSSRSNSNAFVGAMGLGSKSPFCYTDGFTIVSCHQGRKRTYSAYIGDTGTPMVVLLTEEETTEPNGLEVQFPVKQDDIWEFENKAKIALEFFDPKPNINIKIDLHETKYVMKTDRWGLRTDAYEDTHHTDKVRAIQGLVQYSIGNIDHSRLNTVQQKLVELPLDIFFPIGELSVAASRETLSNDERTIGNVIKAMDAIQDDLIAETKKKVAQCSHYWEARILLWNLGNVAGLGPIVNKAVEAGLFDGNYGNFIYSKTAPTVNELDYEHVTVAAFTKRWRHTVTAAKEYVFKVTAPEDRAQAETYVQTSKRNKASYDRHFQISDDVMFVIGDLLAGEKYIHYFLTQAADNVDRDGVKKARTVYFIARLNKDHATADVLREADDIIKKLGNPPSVLLSELKERYDVFFAKSVKAPSSGPRKLIWFDASANISRYCDGYQRSGWGNAWKSEHNPLPTGRKFYIKVKSLKPVDYEYDFAENFGELLNNVRKSGEFDIKPGERIYGLSEEVMKSKKVDKDPTWVEFFSYVFTTLPTLITPAKIAELSLYLGGGFNFSGKKYLLQFAKHKPLPPDSPMQQFCEAFDTANKVPKEKAQAFVGLVNIGKSRGIVTAPDKQYIIDFDKAWLGVINKYPLLKLLSFNEYGYPGDAGERIVEYCRLVDAHNQAVKANQLSITIDGQEGENAQEASEVSQIGSTDPVCAEV